MEEVDAKIRQAAAEKKAMDALSTGKFVYEEETSLNDALMLEIIQKAVNSPQHSANSSHHLRQSHFDVDNNGNHSSN